MSTNPIDVENGVGFGQKKCLALDNVITVAKLIDTFRFCYPMKREYTFFRPGCAPSRLDRIYVSAGLEEGINCVSHIASLSDHSGVKLDINLDLHSPPKLANKDFSYWKLNVAILKDESFMPCFRVLWKDISSQIPFYSDVAL